MDNPAPGAGQQEYGGTTMANSGGVISASSQLGMVDSMIISKRHNPGPDVRTR